MPSPRSVLIDLTENGLPMNKPQSAIGGSGRLRGHAVETSEVKNPTKAEAKKPEPKPGLVKIHCDSCAGTAECACSCSTCVEVKPEPKPEVVKPKRSKKEEK